MHEEESFRIDQLEKALQGDEDALAALLESCRGRLSRMVALRMDPRVRSRIDASDVVQETFIDATRGLTRYSRDSDPPFYLWLRLLAGQRLAKAHRKHLGAAKRQVQREISIEQGSIPDLSTFHLASQLIGSLTSASAQLIREESRTMVQEILDKMEPNDREVLALRHFEEMTAREVASVLGISESAAKSRYRRALLRIGDAIGRFPDRSKQAAPSPSAKPERGKSSR